jgi:hypothetical protein
MTSQTNSTFRVVCRSENGCVLLHGGCSVIQVEFGNLLLRFEPKAFTAFKTFIDGLDLAASQGMNQERPYTRKVFVELKPSGLMVAFHACEVLELRRLLASADAVLTLRNVSLAAIVTLN